MIKPDEMIDMRVRDEDVFEAMNLSRRQMRDIAEVKQDRALFKERFDIERRVPGSSIDQAGMQDRSHLLCLTSASPPGIAPNHGRAANEPRVGGNAAAVTRRQGPFLPFGTSPGV